MGLCCSSEKPAQSRPSSAICIQRFQQPVHPYGSTVNGVRFFKLAPVDDLRPPSDALSVYSSPLSGLQSQQQQQQEWLGKEYSQSFDELEFYVTACQLRNEDDNGQWRVFNFLPSFHGLLRGAMIVVPSSGSEQGGSRWRSADLVVFRSPLEGLVRPRLLSLTLGPQSNALQYRRGSDLDCVLFARKHGIAVEGMLSPPKSVLSEDPGFDAKGWAWGNSEQPRAKRVELQSRRLSEVLSALIDFRDTVIEEEIGASASSSFSDVGWPTKSISSRSTGGLSGLDTLFLGASEFSELALASAVHELASLLHASIDVPVPQKWVGSSVAIITEAGMAPPRLSPVDPKYWVSSRVRVRLLGWNRSQVTHPLSKVSPDEEADNQVMWQIYMDSLGCLLWEAARLYLNSFCAEEWQTLSFEVYESHPSSEKTVLLGTTELALTDELREDEDFDLQNLPLALPADVAGGQAASPELIVRVRYVKYHPSSRLAGAWYVRVVSAEGLPPPDGKDPHLQKRGREVHTVVTARERMGLGVRRFSQRTAKNGNRSQPSWNEDLHFPTVADGNQAAERLRQTLGCGRSEESMAGDEAAGNPVDSTESLMKHLMDPDVQQPAADIYDGQDMATVMAIRQMAFIMEVRAGWLDAIQPVFPPPR